MSVNFQIRSTEKEILDDFNLSGNQLDENLKELALVNSLLGGYKVVLGGLREIFKRRPDQRAWHICDVGSGGGDTLKEISKTFPDENISLLGIDANATAVEYARNQCADKRISFQQMNVFSADFRNLKADIYLFNLFLHHFTEDEIVEILKISSRGGGQIIINDLQRSGLAYHLFRLSSYVLGFSKISRHDGLLSIRKAFTPKDWEDIMAKSGISNYSIKWCWAFRYRIITY